MSLSVLWVVVICTRERVIEVEDRIVGFTADLVAQKRAVFWVCGDPGRLWAIWADMPIGVGRDNLWP